MLLLNTFYYDFSFPLTSAKGSVMMVQPMFLVIKVSGLRTRILKDEIRATYVHCRAHNLNGSPRSNKKKKQKRNYRYAQLD